MADVISWFAGATGADADSAMVITESEEQMVSFYPSGSNGFDDSARESGNEPSHHAGRQNGCACSSALLYATASPILQPDGSYHIYIIGGIRERSQEAAVCPVQRFTLPAGGGPLIGPDPTPVTLPDDGLAQHSAVAVGTSIYIIGNAFARQGQLLRFNTENQAITPVEFEDPDKVGIPNYFYCATSSLMKTAEGADVIVTYGGVGSRTPTSDIYMYHIERNEWRKVPKKAPSPPPRLYHAACSSRDGRYLYVIGGAPDAKTTTGKDTVFSDFWRYDLHRNSWMRIQPSAGSAPSRRGSCSLLAYGSFLYLYGGFNGVDDLTDCYRYDTVHNVWSLASGLDPIDHSVGRWGYASCVCGDDLFYFGGFCKRRHPGEPLDRARLAESVQLYRPEKPSLRQMLARMLASSAEDSKCG